MKNLLLIALVAIAASTAAYGQKKVVKKPAAKPTVVIPAPKPIVRDKFDPKRDPNADLAAAITVATKTNKRIILDVGGEWCGWCVEMDEYFLKNPALLKIRERDFVWVKVNMSPENENTAFLSKYPTIEGYPHLFVLESDGSLLASQETNELEEPTPEPVVLKRDAAGKPVLVDLGTSSYDLYKMVEFLNKWIRKN